MKKNTCSTLFKPAALSWSFCLYRYKGMLYMCVSVDQWFNHLGVLKHAQVSVHAQCSGFVASAFVKLGCLVEFPLVGIDVCQEQLIVALTPLLPLLQISQHKHWHVCGDKHSHTTVIHDCTQTHHQSNITEGTENYWLARSASLFRQTLIPTIKMKSENKYYIYRIQWTFLSHHKGHLLFL